MKHLALALLTVFLGSARASDFYMKAGAGDWADKANFFTDQARTQPAANAPAAGDTVYLIGAETYTASDADADSFAVFSQLNEIRVLAGSDGRFPFLDVTVANGEKSVDFEYLYDRTGHITVTNATLIKRGTGTLAFSRNTDDRACHASLDIREGTVRLPQGTSASAEIGFLNLAAGATLVLAGNSAKVGETSFAGIQTAAGSLMTNISSRANTFSSFDNPLLGRGGDSVIAGRVGGMARPWTTRNITFLATDNTFSETPYIQGNKGNFHTLEPWKNCGVYSCAKIGGDGTPSSLGQTKALIFFANGGGLRYLGTGETAARELCIQNTSVYPDFIDGGPCGNLEWTGNLTLTKNVAFTNVYRFFFIGTNRTACVWSGSVNEPKNGEGESMPVHFTKAGSGTWRFADNASRCHHGGTTIAEGTLVFDSIAAKGEMCALGYSDRLTADDPYAVTKGAWVDYAFTLGGTNRAGVATEPVFAYNGTVYAHVTNRPIALAFGGGTLRGSSEGGYLDFSGIWARDDGATPTLTLDGTAAECGCAGAISNGAANARVSVAKTGAGRWNLADNLAFSGDLGVRAGTLNVVGARSKTNTYYRITIKGVGNGGSEVNCRQFAFYDANGCHQNIGLLSRTNEAARTAQAPALVRRAFDLQPGEAAYGAPLSYKMKAAMPAKPDSDLDGLFPTVSGTSSTISHQFNITTSKKITRDDPSSWVVVVLRLKDNCPPITHFDIQLMSASTGLCPKYVTIEGSSDGLAWQPLFDNTDTGFDLTKGSLTFNPDDGTMCCYCLGTGLTDGADGCEKSSTGKHCVKGYQSEAGVNKWLSTGADNSSVWPTTIRKYEEGVRCFKFTGTAELAQFPAPSALPNVSYVSVADGAVLDLPTGTPVSKLRVDATGAGTLRGAAFAAHGTVDLVNLPQGSSAELPGTYADCTGLANLSGWTVTKNGKSSGWKIRVSGNRLTAIRPGTNLLVR